MTPAVRDIILSNRVAWSWMGDGSRVWDFTRASDGTRFNSAGSWETIATNGLRYDFDPTTGALRGVLIEPARTNNIRNGAMAGAVVGIIGSGGVSPTNFLFNCNGNIGTLTTEISAVGTQDGIDYCDFRVAGTPSGSGFVQIIADTSTAIVAASGQVWAGSMFLYLSGGSSSNISGPVLVINEYTSGGAFVVNGSSGIALSATRLSASRRAIVRTLSGGGTVARAGLVFAASYVAGPVDITFRLGLPQMEQIASGAPVATTPIRTTGSAATRAVDALSLPVPPGVYSVEVIGGSILLAGTRYTDTVTVTGTSWSFAWPAAAVTAGERHLQRVSMRRIG